MNKKTLEENVQKNMNTTKDALQLVYNTLNQGQRKKILKDEQIKELFDRYGVEY